MTRVGPHPLDELDNQAESLGPFWAIKDIDDEECVLQWGNKAVDKCISYYGAYFNLQMDNLLLFKGVHWLNQDRHTSRFLDREGVATRRSPKVVLNHLWDSVEQRTSRYVRFKPAVRIYPTNTEYEDEQDAKVAKYVLDHIWYENNADKLNQEWVRQALICGESYKYITWDPRKGDVHPTQIEAKKQGEKIPLLDGEGEPIVSRDGDPMYIEKVLRVGDVRYDLDPPWHTLDEPCRNRDDITWTIRWKAVDLDTLKAQYPDMANKIKADMGFEIFNKYRLDFGKMSNETIVFELFCKSSEFLDNGRYVKFTKSCVLENSKLPYSHGKLPYTRLTDIDIPDEIRGMSFFQQLFPLQHQINACASLIFKSLILFSHPKWAFPSGSVQITQLANESTLIGYDGAVPPQLLNTHPVGQELFAYLEKLESTYDKLSGVFTMSRGTAPSGVRAAKALRVLEEQEDKRAALGMIKFNEGVVNDAKMTLSVAGDYYKEDEGRLARVVGKGNRHMLVKFRAANLSKPYDIRVVETTALSQSPSARIEELMEMQNMRFDPTAPFSREQFFSLLNFDSVDEFRDIATRAVECAKSENEDILAGRQVPSPTMTEDLIVHWKLHLQPMQAREYKDPQFTPPEIRMALEEHLKITEFAMFEKAFGYIDEKGMQRPGNVLFQQKMMMECVEWPVLFTLPAPYMIQPPMMGGPAEEPMAEGAPSEPPPPQGNEPV